jgi:hypothetical protein
VLFRSGYGTVNLATNEEYDPATNSWATRLAMPTARRQLDGAAIGGKIYAIGGYTSSANNRN